MMHKISFTALAKPTRSQAWQPLSLTLPFPLPSAYSPTHSPSLLSLIDAHQSIWQHFQGAQSLSLSLSLTCLLPLPLSLSLTLGDHRWLSATPLLALLPSRGAVYLCNASALPVQAIYLFRNFLPFKRVIVLAGDANWGFPFTFNTLTHTTMAKWQLAVATRRATCSRQQHQGGGTLINYEK